MLAFLKRSKPDYQTQLEWAPTKQILLAWDIKLVAHDWFFPTLHFITFMTIFFMLFGGILYWGGVDLDILKWFTFAWYAFLALFILLQVRVKNQFVYQLTAEGLEYHRWRVYPEFLFSGAKGMLVAIGVIVLIAGIFSQHGFLILAGPVSIAIASFIRVGSSDYKKWAVNYSSAGANWTNIFRMQYDPSKKLVRLDYDFKTSKEKLKRIAELSGVSAIVTNGEYDLFLTKENEQQALSILQLYLPNIPLETTKLKLPEIV